MYATDLPMRQRLEDAHRRAWDAIAAPGASWTGAQRVAMVAESRHARACALCSARRQALSPAAISGDHDHLGQLPTAVIEVIHRVRTDPGRLTRAWFDQMMASGLTVEQYVEIVGVINTALILDGFAFGLGLDPTPLPQPRAGDPDGQFSDAVVDVGAWVPVADATIEPGVGGMPSAPMIGRAMGRVPAAVALFFGVARQHYQLQQWDVDLERAQIELLAARVSAINQCFY